MDRIIVGDIMKKKEKKRVLLFLGICCFILVGILVFLIVVNISALNKASMNAKPWKELYHCVDMRIGNHDNATSALDAKR